MLRARDFCDGDVAKRINRHGQSLLRVCIQTERGAAEFMGLQRC